MTDLPSLERVYLVFIFYPNLSGNQGKSWRTGFPGDFQSGCSFGHTTNYKLPQLPSSVQRRRGASQLVAQLDYPCTCKAVASLQALKLQFKIRRGGKWIRSPVPRVSPLAVTVQLGICVGNTQCEAAGCTPGLVAFPCCKETSVTHGMFFPCIQRGTVPRIPSTLSKAMRNHAFPNEILLLL